MEANELAEKEDTPKAKKQRVSRPKTSVVATSTETTVNETNPVDSES